MRLQALEQAVYLVPGQGGDPRGALRGLCAASAAAAAQTEQVTSQIRQAADGTADATAQADAAGHMLLAAGGPAAPLQHETGLLAGYALSVILGRLLTAAGKPPSLVVGVSFGEIAALVCAGALDVTDGARAVLALNEAYRPAAGLGGMVLLAGAGEEECAQLLADSGIEGLVIACVNSPVQTVVSGPAAAVDKLLALPAPGVKLIRVPVPYAAHHPALGYVREHFASAMRGLRQRPLRVPVHSPVRGRAYTDADDLREAMADALVKPVRLPQILAGIGSAPGGTPAGEAAQRQFIELGVGGALVRCVQQTLPGAQTLDPLAAGTRWLAGSVQ